MGVLHQRRQGHELLHERLGSRRTGTVPSALTEPTADRAEPSVPGSKPLGVAEPVATKAVGITETLRAEAVLWVTSKSAVVAETVGIAETLVVRAKTGVPVAEPLGVAEPVLRVATKAVVAKTAAIRRAAAIGVGLLGHVEGTIRVERNDVAILGDLVAMGAIGLDVAPLVAGMAI